MALKKVTAICVFFCETWHAWGSDAFNVWRKKNVDPSRSFIGYLITQKIFHLDRIESFWEVKTPLCK